MATSISFILFAETNRFDSGLLIEVMKYLILIALAVVPVSAIFFGGGGGGGGGGILLTGDNLISV